MNSKLDKLVSGVSSELRDEPMTPVNIAQDLARGSQMAKIVTHRLKMLESLMMTVGSSGHDSLGEADKYWREVVDIIIDKCKEWFPHRRGEIRPDEVGAIESATRFIARDGFRSGVAPDVYMKPLLDNAFFDTKTASYTDNPKKTESAYMVFSYIKGTQQIRGAVDTLVRQILELSDTALERSGLTRNGLLNVMIGEKSSEQVAREVYSYSREKAQTIAKHFAEVYSDETMANQATVSNFASSASSSIKDRVRYGFNDFHQHLISSWADPLVREEIVKNGAVAHWFKLVVDHFVASTITITDSNEDYLNEGLVMNDPRVLERAEGLDSLIKSGGIKNLIEESVTSSLSDTAQSPEEPVSSNSFRSILNRQGVETRTFKPSAQKNDEQDLDDA